MFHYVTSIHLRRVSLTIGLTLTLLWLLSEVLTVTHAAHAKSNALARALSVNQTVAWYVAPPPLGSDANDCASAATPCATVQHAIDVAADGDQVFIASGLYTQSLTLRKPVSLTGVNSDTTIIHAVAGQRVLTVTGATISNSVVISGLTFTGGDATDGGGAYLDAPLMILNARFISNTASNFGGGLYARAAITLTDVEFVGNTTQQSGGGAWLGDLTNIDGGRFVNNQAIGNNSRGGGLFASASLTISKGQFTNNVAGFLGGGLMAGSTVSPTTNTLTLSNTNFVGNVASHGGGVYAQQNVLLTRGAFILNQCTESRPPECVGGALAVLHYLGAPLDLAITGTQFISNSALNNSWGGAVYYGADGTGRIVNALFANNSTQGAGAALFFNFNRSVALLNSTITNLGLNPTAAIAVFNNSSVSITNTIIANHFHGIQTFEGFNGTVTEDYNLFYGNLTNTVKVITGAHSIVGTPQFIDPNSDNYALRFGSAAIDSGVDAGVRLDIDGYSRPQGYGFDIGAYEYHGPVFQAFLPVMHK